MYKDRKIYFAALFSIFILFALLIFFKKPIYLDESHFSVIYLMPSVFIPALLIFLRKKNMYIKIFIAYIPAIIGFILAITLKNSVYFLSSFPIFLISFIVIFPRGKDERIHPDNRKD